MKPKEQAVIEMCIENGIAYGMTRAYKHTDEPTDDQIKFVLRDAIMHEIYEWFYFEETEVWDK
jgi:hypothetical protein